LLGEAAQPIVVVAAPGQDLPPLSGDVQIVRDEHEGRGPLEGLAAGLQALPKGIEAGYLTSCDAPFLVPAFVRRLAELLGEADIAVPEVDGRRHPLSAVYRPRVLPVVRRLLDANRLRLGDLPDETATRFVSANELTNVDPTLQTLRNLNTAEEYEIALRDLSPPGRIR
jgi:molybdopterin-guanine dinucleotide biosynthesis protein A